MHFFTSSALTFLNNLQQNNNRDWFLQNKSHYEELVREPALDFIDYMQPHIAAISKHFVADARKTGGSLLRINRDTRFSKDKTPYKTNIGIQFRHQQGKDIHAPGFYLHISVEQIFIGCGIWRPDNSALNKIRDEMLAEPNNWQSLKDEIGKEGYFSFHGDCLKRMPRGYDKNAPFQDDLKRKDFLIMHEIPEAIISDEHFSEEIINGFGKAGNFMRFLCRALDIAF